MTDQDRLNIRLFYAAQKGDLKALSQELAGGANAKAHDSRALWSAAENGHAECVRRLIPLSDPMAEDSYALTRAAHNGHVECVKLLIPVSDPLGDRSLALRFAAANGHAECVALLLPVSDPLARRSEGLDAAAFARRYEHMTVAAMIEAFMEAKELSQTTQRAKPGSRVKSAL